MAWVVDMRHYLDKDGTAIASPHPAALFAALFGSIVSAISSVMPGTYATLEVACRRRPGRRRCAGRIQAIIDADDCIRWICLVCGDHGYIHHWRATPWDCRQESTAAHVDSDMTSTCSREGGYDRLLPVNCMTTFTAYVEWDPATKLYVGIVPGLAGAHTQAATLDELRRNLQEVIELCLEELGPSADDLPRFVGLQQIEVSV